MITSTEFIDNNGIIAEVKRTERRKTATIKVEDGHVFVVVPKQLEKQRIIKLLNEKKSWINDKVALHQQVSPASSKEFVSGESFPYLGRNYRLKLHQGEYSPVKLVKGYLELTVQTSKNDSVFIRHLMLVWYKRNAEQKLKQKCKRFATKLGVFPRSISVRDYKSRWGSCSAEGDISFNWKIIMAPNKIVDYVVAHELCHLIQHDHSPLFWKQVEREVPDYAECKAWLKNNGQKLNF